MVGHMSNFFSLSGVHVLVYAAKITVAYSQIRLVNMTNHLAIWLVNLQIWLNIIQWLAVIFNSVVVARSNLRALPLSISVATREGSLIFIRVSFYVNILHSSNIFLHTIVENRILVHQINTTVRYVTRSLTAPSHIRPTWRPRHTRKKWSSSRTVNHQFKVNYCSC